MSSTVPAVPGTNQTNSHSKPSRVTSFKPPQVYKVEQFSEGFFGVLFLGAASINPKKIEAALNKYASEGYYVVETFTEKRRKFIFWQVDSAIIIFAKDRK